MPSHPKVAKGIIVGSFTGLASIPGLFYALVVRPVQTVDDGSVKSASKQAAVLHNASNTGRVLFVLGLFFLALLVAYLILGFVSQEREVNDER